VLSCLLYRNDPIRNIGACISRAGRFRVENRISILVELRFESTKQREDKRRQTRTACNCKLAGARSARSAWDG
jgi:hypothetical protein